jgi:hypothetical protein
MTWLVKHRITGPFGRRDLVKDDAHREWSAPDRNEQSPCLSLPLRSALAAPYGMGPMTTCYEPDDYLLIPTGRPIVRYDCGFLVWDIASTALRLGMVASSLCT